MNPTQITVKLSSIHTPSKFFTTKEGLYVWNDFTERIVSKAHPTKKGVSFNIQSLTLSERKNDAAIENLLPKNHLFDESTVCAVVAGMISKQQNGEVGDLENTGYANLFYTGSFVVDVGWRGDGREWLVDAWDRDGGGWDAGLRAFSPATQTLGTESSDTLTLESFDARIKKLEALINPELLK